MLKDIISYHFRISFLFIIFGVLFGLLYSLQLLSLYGNILTPTDVRSLHISIMLYGFAPLILSILPFALFHKDNLDSYKGNNYLKTYFITWYIFIIFMIFSLIFGNTRGLAFYDFPYELNIILALAGIFYLLAILHYIKQYKVKPLWVKISLFVVVIAPLVLLILMNPSYGQVQYTVSGPHGDNTLGMSLFLVLLYYLSIKLASKEKNIYANSLLWIIPLGFYSMSILYRNFIDHLSYNQEWFLQYLTLLYIPLLYFWFKNAKLKIKENLFLFISIISFVFIDIEGNILFIPELHTLFHRNDLIIGHAHIAVGISFLFLSFSIIKDYINIDKKYILIWTLLLTLIGIVLSLSGFYQADLINVDTRVWWKFRSLFGLLFFISILIFYFKSFKIKISNKLSLYHLIGFLSDGLGAIILILFAKPIYLFLNFQFDFGYQVIIFGFMLGLGITHLLALIKVEYQNILAITTTITRIIVASLFFALYKAQYIDTMGLIVTIYDLSFAFIFISMKNAFYKQV